MSFDSLVASLVSAHSQMASDGYVYNQALAAWETELALRGLTFLNKRNGMPLSNTPSVSVSSNEHDLNVLATNLSVAQSLYVASITVHNAAMAAHKKALSDAGAV